MSKTRFYLQKIQAELNQKDKTASVIFYNLLKEYKARFSKNSQSKFLILVDSLLQNSGVNTGKQLSINDKKSTTVIDEKSLTKMTYISTSLPLDMKCAEMISKINTYFTRVTFDKDSEFAALIKAFLFYFNDQYREFFSENIQQKIPTEEICLSLLGAPKSLFKLNEKYTDDKIHDQKSQVSKFFSSENKDKIKNDQLIIAQESISSMSLIINQAERSWLIEYYKYQITKNRNPEIYIKLGNHLAQIGLNGTHEQLDDIFEFSTNKLGSSNIIYVHTALMTLIKIADRLTVAQRISTILKILKFVILGVLGTNRNRITLKQKLIIHLVSEFVRSIPELEWGQELQLSLLNEFNLQKEKHNECIKSFPELLSWLKTSERIKEIKNFAIQPRNFLFIADLESLTIFINRISELPEVSREEIVQSLMGVLIYYQSPALKLKMIEVIYEMMGFNILTNKQAFDTLMKINFDHIYDKLKYNIFIRFDSLQKQTLLLKWLTDLSQFDVENQLVIGILHLYIYLMFVPIDSSTKEFLDLIRNGSSDLLEKLRPQFQLKQDFYKRLQGMVQINLLYCDNIMALISRSNYEFSVDFASVIHNLSKSISQYIKKNDIISWTAFFGCMQLNSILLEQIDIRKLTSGLFEMAFENWSVLPKPQKITTVEALYHCVVNAGEKTRIDAYIALKKYSAHLTHLQAMQFIMILCDRLNDPNSPITPNEYQNIVQAVCAIFYEKESKRLVNVRLKNPALSSMVIDYAN